MVVDIPRQAPAGHCDRASATLYPRIRLLLIGAALSCPFTAMKLTAWPLSTLCPKKPLYSRTLMACASNVAAASLHVRPVDENAALVAVYCAK